MSLITGSPLIQAPESNFIVTLEHLSGHIEYASMEELEHGLTALEFLDAIRNGREDWFMVRK
jgi:hypothetical protein